MVEKKSNSGVSEKDFAHLEAILDAKYDSLSDLEGFLTKTIEAVAKVVKAKSSRLVLYKDKEGDAKRHGDDSKCHSLRLNNRSISVPLIIRGLDNPIGYIEVKGKRIPFDDRDMVSLMMMGRQATLKIENDLFYRNILETMLEMLSTLVFIIESKDPYIHLHSSRVSNYAMNIAKGLQMPDEDINKIRIASLLHDIGKIGIPDNILCKESPLTDKENEIIKTHSIIGENIIKPLGFLFEEKEIVRHHHEYFDGSGYPDGLRGKEIPIGDRIISVADAFDAMTSNRPYRLAKSVKVSFEEIEGMRNIRYDPLVIKSFQECLEYNTIANPAGFGHKPR